MSEADRHGSLQHRKQIVCDPEQLLHRYDETNDHFQFVTVPRFLHRQCAFLTKEHLPKDIETTIFQRADIAALRPASAPIHFIFHSAYCCSTLLARAFDIEGRSMGLKEPVILNDMVGWKRRGGEGRKIAEVLDQAMHHLAKPFIKGEAIIIKPSNVVNSLAIAMLAMRGEARAILLYAPLRTYIRSIAMKNLWGRLWVRTLLTGQMTDGMIAPFGLTIEELLQLSDLQVAALGWLAQHRLFLMLAQKYGPTRVQTLNSEKFLARLPHSMKRLVDFYQITISDSELQAVLGGPAFKRHSKLNTQFDTDSRKADQANAASLHADEIEKVYEWARITAEQMKIPMELDSALI